MWTNEKLHIDLDDLFWLPVATLKWWPHTQKSIYAQNADFK